MEVQYGIISTAGFDWSYTMMTGGTIEPHSQNSNKLDHCITKHKEIAIKQRKVYSGQQTDDSNKSEM